MDGKNGIRDLIDRARTDAGALAASDWAALLAADGAAERAALFAAALAVKHETAGPIIRPRGLIEFSNLCARDCRYCGIRRGNREVNRYSMSADEIAAAARQVAGAGYGSLVLQSGERSDEAFTGFVTEVLERVHAETGGELKVTLSAGEQTATVYENWRRAGAHRYLLRIETSSPELYGELHPADHSWVARREALDRLRDTGYQVGSGVLIGAPGQTVEHLAADLLFLREVDVDMIGMGPFIPHEGTPLAGAPHDAGRQLDLGLAMIACARLLMPEVNIASATALEALAPDGRRRGLLAGANVVMPNHTPAEYRGDYELYEGKPVAADPRGALAAVAESIGEEVGWGEAGDSVRWGRRSDSR